MKIKYFSDTDTAIFKFFNLPTRLPHQPARPIQLREAGGSEFGGQARLPLQAQPGGQVAETKEISENLYIDLDKSGNLVSMTVEHAKTKANITEISYLQMETKAN